MGGQTVTVWRTVSSVVLRLLVLLLLVRGAEACVGRTCAECISSGAECAWCADANFTSVGSKRCDAHPVLKEKGCLDIQDPWNAKDVKRDDAVTDGRDGTGNDAVQLQPQKMHLKVRPKGNGIKFDVTFRAAKNFPVDLYFLFDVSATMEDSLKELSKLALEMATAIKNISTNYHLGYGVFQDKVILPFTSTHPVKLKNPFPNSNTNQYAPAFAFSHLLALTRNLDSFREAVNRSLSKVTGNLDRPEGGLDAMMQAIVCGQTMGWRNNSRQIIILASDARMHYAGDGKLAGLITPNDGLCHLTHNGSNAMSEKQDYPSLGQISAALDRSKKYVIFAVKESIIEEYKNINKRVARSTYSALTVDNSIVDIVETKYREMTKGVRLEQETTSDNIQVTITPDCEQSDGTSCTGLKIGEEVRFSVNVRAKSCPANLADRVQNITIAPSDFRLDKLTITVEVLCDCDCQIEDSSMVPSDDCSQGNGTIECGVCRCFPGRTGSICECSQRNDDLTLADTSPCKEGGNSSTTPDCSGTGECECGVCKCQIGYSGKYCQCNDRVCPVFDGLVCAGNGECDCEQCHCLANFTGKACQCPDSNDVCIPKGADGGAGQVCSGHGMCVCDELRGTTCSCYQGYRGMFCEECRGSNCTLGTCEDEEVKKNCAMCEVYDKDVCKSNDTLAACPKRALVEIINEEEHGKLQHTYTTDNCKVTFAFKKMEATNSSSTDCASSMLYVHKYPECPPPPVLWIVVAGIVGGVVAVGLLLLLLWKILTMLFDKMEYAHFAHELKTHKWAKQVNPLYKGASTTYYNPIVDRSPNRSDDL